MKKSAGGARRTTLPRSSGPTRAHSRLSRTASSASTSRTSRTSGFSDGGPTYFRSSGGSSSRSSGFSGGGSYDVDTGVIIVGVILVFLILLIVAYVAVSAIKNTNPETGVVVETISAPETPALSSTLTTSEALQWYDVPEEYSPYFLPAEYVEEDVTCQVDCIIIFIFHDHGRVPISGDWIPDPDNPGYEVFMPEMSQGLQLEVPPDSKFFEGFDPSTGHLQALSEPVELPVTSYEQNRACYDDCYVLYVMEDGTQLILYGDWEIIPDTDEAEFAPKFQWVENK